jgi:hypothetical protein
VEVVARVHPNIMVSRLYWLERKKGTYFLNNIPVKILYTTKNYLVLGNKESKKMKFETTRTRILIVSAVLILAIYIILPVSAETPYYKASGTIDSYGDAWSAVIVGGHWSVIFTYIFTTEDYELKGKVLTFSGTIEAWKVWTTIPDWTTVPVPGFRDATITITPTTFYMDTDPPGPGPGPDGLRHNHSNQITPLFFFKPLRYTPNQNTLHYSHSA